VFLHSVGSTGNIVHSGASGAQNIDTLFFMPECDWYGFNKNCVRSHYVEHVFLHPVGYAGHVVNSGASRARNADTLFFMLG
jgi:hypothetical protein